MIEYTPELDIILVSINWVIAGVSLIVALVYSFKISRLVRWPAPWRAITAGCVVGILLAVVYALTWTWGGIESSRVALRDILLPLVCIFIFYGVRGIHKGIMDVMG